MNIQLTDIKYKINRIELRDYDEKLEDIVFEMQGYTVSCLLNRTIDLTIDLEAHEELTIEEIKEEILRLLAKEYPKIK